MLNFFVGTVLGMNGTTITYPIPIHHQIDTAHYAVFRILIIVGEDADDIVHRQLPPIPSDSIWSCISLMWNLSFALDAYVGNPLAYLWNL